MFGVDACQHRHLLARETVVGPSRLTGPRGPKKNDA